MCRLTCGVSLTPQSTFENALRGVIVHKPDEVQTLAIIHPKVRGFICTTTHPKGCELNVRDQIEATRKRGVREDGPKKVLVIGAARP